MIIIIIVHLYKTVAIVIKKKMKLTAQRRIFSCDLIFNVKSNYVLMLDYS